MKPKVAVTQDELRERFRWKRVEYPKSWNPEEPAELVGFFAGKVKKEGQFGPYEIVLIAVPGEGVKRVTGTRVVELIDSAQVDYGQPIVISFKGKTQTKNGFHIKEFDLFVADGIALTEAEMPVIRADA